MNRYQAEEEFWKHMERGTPQAREVLTVLNVVERPYGWVFFYQSRQFVDRGDIAYVLVGNAPLLVLKEGGTVHETGTAHPVEHYLANFERFGTCHPAGNS